MGVSLPSKGKAGPFPGVLATLQPLKSRKQGKATNCFSRNVSFTKAIISASFLGRFQTRLSRLLQTVKDLLANNVFCRSRFCQEMWEMKVRAGGGMLLRCRAVRLHLWDPVVCFQPSSPGRA